jgi:hypothetical protein
VQIAACWLIKSNPHQCCSVMWRCTLKSDEEKSKCAGLSHENGFGSCVCAQFLEAGERRSKSCVHLLEKSVINMIWLLFPIFDRPNITIGPDGLLLVVPT